MNSKLRKALLVATTLILAADVAVAVTYGGGSRPGQVRAAGRAGGAGGIGAVPGGGGALPWPGTGAAGGGRHGKGGRHGRGGSGGSGGSGDAGGNSPGGSGGAVAAGPFKTVRRFTAVNMAPLTGGESEAVAIARANDVISANDGQINSYIPAMRAANPGLVILLYINGSMSLPSEQPNLPAGDFLTASGQRCYHGANASMDPLNSDWRANRVARAKGATGYDGVFLDVMGDSPATPGYLTCLPTDPRTGAPYQQAQFVQDTSTLAQAVSSAIPGRMVVSNGLGSGPAFFGVPTDPLEAAGSGALAEVWIRRAGESMTNFPDPTQWLSDVKMLETAGSRQMYVIVKTWTAGNTDQWHRFSLASYLMGAGPGTAYEFSSANTESGIDGDSPMDHTDMGTALGPMQAAGAGYQRTFDKGLALVNPSTGPVTFTLPPGSFTDLSGATASGSITLQPDTGDLFLQQ